MVEASHCPFKRKLLIPILVVFGLTRPGIEPVSTVSVADALSTPPRIGFNELLNRKMVAFRFALQSLL